jgi:hypothetical protein
VIGATSLSTFANRLLIRAFHDLPSQGFADHFLPAAHHEKGSCSPASPELSSPPIYFSETLQIKAKAELL